MRGGGSAVFWTSAGSQLMEAGTEWRQKSIRPERIVGVRTKASSRRVQNRGGCSGWLIDIHSLGEWTFRPSLKPSEQDGPSTRKVDMPMGVRNCRASRAFPNRTVIRQRSLTGSAASAADCIALVGRSRPRFPENRCNFFLTPKCDLLLCPLACREKVEREPDQSRGETPGASRAFSPSEPVGVGA